MLNPLLVFYFCYTLNRDRDVEMSPQVTFSRHQLAQPCFLWTETAGNSIYKIYIKLNIFHIFETKYIDLLNKYIKKGSD